MSPMARTRSPARGQGKLLSWKNICKQLTPCFPLLLVYVADHSMQCHGKGLLPFSPAGADLLTNLKLDIDRDNEFILTGYRLGEPYTGSSADGKID